MRQIQTLILLLIVLSLASAAELKYEEWKTIPDIKELEISSSDSVRFKSNHRLQHVLKDGGEFVHHAYIDATTGKVINTPEKALELTFKIGESCFQSGLKERDYLEYKLIKIENGQCFFLYSRFKSGEKISRMISVKPYKEKSEQLAPRKD